MGVTLNGSTILQRQPSKIFKPRGLRFFYDLISMGNILKDVRSTKDTIMLPPCAWDHLGVVAYCWIVVSMVYSCQSIIALALQLHNCFACFNQKINPWRMVFYFFILLLRLLSY